MNSFAQIPEPKERWIIAKINTDTGEIIAKFEDYDFDTAITSAANFNRHHQNLII